MFCMRKRLLAHQAIHSDERPFKCEECPKSYKWHGGLIAHRRLHKGEKPFKCDECDAAFTYESGLKNHKRRHHADERPVKHTKHERMEQ
ncbi:hypothetical protein AAVH_28095 [Aphelenchoides avenae]|nr:hypothetical protein AAVH_28095 [Aphelenchus avenae]